MNSPNTQVASTRQARKLNKPTCRPRDIALFAGDEELAPANILAFNGAVNTDFAQPFVEDEFQGYLLDSGIVKASDGKDYLIADMVQESVRDGNGRSEQYVLPINLGDVNTRNWLQTNSGIVASNPSTLATLAEYSVSDLEAQLDTFNHRFVLFNAVVVTKSTMFDLWQEPGILRGQNAIAQDIIRFGKQTLRTPYGKAAQTELLANIINTPIQDGFDVGSVPLGLIVITQ